jgi:hypothetical protein
MIFWNKDMVWKLTIFLMIGTFTILGSVPIAESASEKTQTKATPGPVKKKTAPGKPAVTAPKSKTAPAKSPAAFSQIIATAAGARVRAKASTSSAELQRVKLGTIIKVLEKTDNDWYRIEIPAKPKNLLGWMSGQVADDWDASKREEIYLRIIEKNYQADQMSFLDASELFEFLTKAQTEIKNAKLLPDFGFKRLLALRLALKAIPFNKADEKPYKEFLKKNEKIVVYSEPAGEWYVRSDHFWDLRKKFDASPIGEDIAWAAAGNPLPGECEGYVNCYLFILRETDARYLDLYPNGRYTLEALGNIQNLLEPIIADLPEKQVYNGPTDVSDRAEFNRLIAEIRTIVSKLPLAESEKQKTVQQLNKIAEGFR